MTQNQLKLVYTIASFLKRSKKDFLKEVTELNENSQLPFNHFYLSINNTQKHFILVDKILPGIMSLFILDKFKQCEVYYEGVAYLDENSLEDIFVLFSVKGELFVGLKDSYNTIVEVPGINLPGTSGAYYFAHAKSYFGQYIQYDY